MKKSYLSLVAFAALLFFSCENSNTLSEQIMVTNTMNSARSHETVTVDFASLNLSDFDGSIVLMDAESKAEVVSQQIDSDSDGKMDAILFQPEIAANSEKVYLVSTGDKLEVEHDSTFACYSRIVPERTDDYAWENNRVAFRTYGPKAQKMNEEGIKGGTLSSGIDAWLKRVEYPIINKWYKKELETDGSYHKDTGEGLDNFHVGSSRGVGGIAKKVDDTYHFSKNFTAWETLSKGPIRTSFSLTYADWDANGKLISEKKTISLDYGSNLSKFEVDITGVDTISAGLTLHDKKGEIGVNEEAGWISYWEPHEDSELGTGIVVPAGAMVGVDHYLTYKKDESNLFAHLKGDNNKMIYYAGFAWKKSEQFQTKQEWDAYLQRFSECLDNPLVVKVK